MNDRVLRDVHAEDRRATTQDGVDRGTVDQHKDHDARPPEDLGRTPRHARTGCAQWLALVRGTVPDDERRPRMDQIEGHGLSHDTETDETCVHSCRHFLVPCQATFAC